MYDKGRGWGREKGGSGALPEGLCRTTAGPFFVSHPLWTSQGGTTSDGGFVRCSVQWQCKTCQQKEYHRSLENGHDNVCFCETNT